MFIGGEFGVCKVKNDKTGSKYSHVGNYSRLLPLICGLKMGSSPEE